MNSNCIHENKKYVKEQGDYVNEHGWKECEYKYVMEDINTKILRMKESRT